MARISARTEFPMGLELQIPMGWHRTLAGYLAALEEARMVVSDRAMAMLGTSVVTMKPCVAHAAVVQPIEFGCITPVHRGAFLSLARTHGLMECPIEMALAYRLAYRDQRPGENVVVFTEPRFDTEGRAECLCVAHDGSFRSLRANYNDPHDQWLPERHLLMMRPFAN